MEAIFRAERKEWTRLKCMVARATDVCRRSSVDKNAGACNLLRAGTGQEIHGCGDIARFPIAAQGDELPLQFGAVSGRGFGVNVG